jgi:uncharacterized protein YeaO (DUF488 family)
VIKLKRIYEKPERADGKRFLVDRLWPRGLSKENAHVDEWLKEIAPSDTLRRWYGHKVEQCSEFRQKHRAELRKPGPLELLAKLRQEGKHRTITLLHAVRDSEHSNAAVLNELLGNE